MNSAGDQFCTSGYIYQLTLQSRTGAYDSKLHALFFGRCIMALQIASECVGHFPNTLNEY